MASTSALVAAAAVFSLTYVLISLRQVARFPLERPATAMLGAAFILLLGVLGREEARASIDVGLILLLVGMMVLVSGPDVCGFFDIVSARITARAKGQASLLAILVPA